MLERLFAVHVNRVFGTVALKALERSRIETVWRHQDTTTLSLSGAYEASEVSQAPAARARDAPGVPRPACGQSKDRRPDLKQVMLSLGVSGDGGLPLRLGLRDGNPSDSTETPVALEECVAWGLEGMVGMVADSKA